MTPQKILVRTPNWIGDQVLAYPFFHYLRAAYPAAHITAVCVPWVAAVQFRHLVDEVHVLPSTAASALWSRAHRLEASARLLRRQGPWDLGICLPNSFSSAWLFMRARVRLRRGYATEQRRWLLHQRLSWATQAQSHRTEAYLALLPEAVRPQKPIQDFWSGLYDRTNATAPGAAHQQFDAVHAWPLAAALEPPEAPYWVLAPGSMAESRRWPAEHYIALARQIHDATGMQGLMIGGPQEAALAQRLGQAPGTQLADWTARGAVPVYWKLLRQARFTVSNDSGLAHIAALCGSPVYVIWGAGNPCKTAPLGPGPVHILHHPVACWPCERNRCGQPPEHFLACLQGMQATAVWEAIQRS